MQHTRALGGYCGKSCKIIASLFSRYCRGVLEYYDYDYMYEDAR